jgi:hypothetical protein
MPPMREPLTEMNDAFLSGEKMQKKQMMEEH